MCELVLLMPPVGLNLHAAERAGQRTGVIGCLLSAFIAVADGSAGTGAA